MGIIKKLGAVLRRKQSDQERISLRAVFARFRAVIDSNTKALELIADMGDKLSGDYIFDMAYIRQVSRDLSEAVFRSIHNLNVLCQNKYDILYQKFDQINAQIENLIEGNIKNVSLIMWLDEVGPEAIDFVGGKMAHLAEIKRRLGFSIPNGFILTSSAFYEYISFNNLEKEIKNFKKALENRDITLEEQRKKIQKAILEGRLSPSLEKNLSDALLRYKEICGDRPLVVRSSAQEEDQELSFAGLFKTIINVSPALPALSQAYKQVIASLFGTKALEYAKRFGSHLLDMAMAVGFLELIEARTSGVIFTVNPQDPKLETILITANWGLGIAIVEGSLPVDHFIVSRKDPNHILQKKIFEKTHYFVPQKEEIVETYLPEDIKRKPCLVDEEIKVLAKAGLSLERYFKRPQDIEWTIDDKGSLYILQSRPLQLLNKVIEVKPLPEIKQKYQIIAEKKGLIAQGGIASGPVFIAYNLEDLDKFPEGAVLVARRDSSHFVRIMPKAAAILTDIGSPTSHMATLCREFRVPAIVGMGNITELVKPGEVITVDADDNYIYRDRVEELLKFQAASQLDLAHTKEFRLLRKILHLVAPLNLVDPLIKDFRPEACKTFHDILRFCHEKAVQELINIGKDTKTLLDKHITKKLKLAIPAGILVIDLDGGLIDEAQSKDEVTIEDVNCLPFKAVLRGMLTPGIWQTEAVQMDIKDFISSMIKTPDITPRYAGENLAAISTYYLNLNLRFGYHFNILDTYSSPNVRENHIYFRFLGGATDLSKRSRRIRLIEKILSYYDFNVITKGDLLVARLSNLPLEEIERLLEMIGRLIGFTRQLDVFMEDDSSIERAFKGFISGKYNIRGQNVIS
ncbi:pyruvate phosphate dikinase PEP/pyruvate-binding protein [Thermodesulfatator indicus DSM 15286]|uniref:Phosphoenolpyruvate synthase n=1 Tax=Thermodesulfatator indicus (strain DSM 15286 / JCM 11887 / CIR29812) TaxID=667014 RepID=F8AD41_THEID|nr:PEP/pyruvate-binding domain-containing protein [Thermodesulfatator indicus]AEH45915.1 pyruvate phosphate dikinase PEP/pyruvate-binding protein [Thermodesulfatator indicus DSM 15286]